MTNWQKIIKTKIGILELARQLGNVSQACKVMGYCKTEDGEKINYEALVNGCFTGCWHSGIPLHTYKR